MKVWGLWYGGSSYATPERSDLEEFPSITGAREIFECRGDGWDPVTRSRCPCVDAGASAYEYGHGAEMQLFFDKPHLDDPYWYPDRIIRFGPRGGVQVIPC